MSEERTKLTDSERLDWLQNNCEVIVSTNMEGLELFGFNAWMRDDCPKLRDLIDGQIQSEND